jgi:hypothetical protein
MCPHTAIYVASYCYIFVLILQYMCPHTALYVSSYCYICGLILLYMCPHTAVCPHTEASYAAVSELCFFFLMSQLDTTCSTKARMPKLKHVVAVTKVAALNWEEGHAKKNEKKCSRKECDNDWLVRVCASHLT